MHIDMCIYIHMCIYIYLPCQTISVSVILLGQDMCNSLHIQQDWNLKVTYASLIKKKK